MATPRYNTYVGMRYVPIFDGEWDRTKTYEPLTIVSYQGNSYTSRTFIPVGMDINNTEYWALTGNYNAQVEYYRQETARVAEEVENCTHTYDNVSAMKADVNLEEGMVCRTLGYNSVNDGGGALYRISGTASEKYYETLVNGLYAELITDDKDQKYVENSDGALTAMAETAMSYIKYTNFTTEVSSEFFYDTSGLYSNWSSNPTETVDGKHGISCSPFVMDMIFGVRYPDSAYINGQNRLDSFMLNDSGLIDFFYTPKIGSKYLAEYALNHGYAFYPDSDLSNVRAGDVIFTTQDSDSTSDSPLGIGHCEVVAYWINNKKFLVWHAGANAPRTNVRTAESYAENVVLCARFPFADRQVEPVNIVNHDEAAVSHTVDDTWLVSDYGLSENIEPYTYYTAIFKMTSANSIADQYPVIKNNNNDNLSQSYSGATERPINDIYCVPFWSATSINKIRLGMTVRASGMPYDDVTVEWMAVVKGVVTSANRFIPPKYTVPLNNASEKLIAGNANGFTPTSGSSYSTFGNCYYYKLGTRVHVHVGIQSLTANTNTTIYTLPEGFRPRGSIMAYGQGDDVTSMSKISVGSSGTVKIWSDGTFALADIEFDAFN